MKIKFVDLFAGIGGIRLGMEQALADLGLEGECVLSSEIDERACETYSLNFGETPKGDIREIDEIEPFDFLLAGFPCQPFSYAGKKRGFGDTRGTLFFEIERLLKKYKPNSFLLENVRGLKTHSSGKTFETIMSTLHEMGYETYDLVINSSEFGVPQNRVRLYILGLLNKKPKKQLETNLGSVDSHQFKKDYYQVGFSDLKKDSSMNLSKRTVGDILEDNPDEKYRCSDNFTEQLKGVVGEDLSKLAGYRLIDYRGGKAIHSWELGIKGKCNEKEIYFMNELIKNRRKNIFGSHQDGKMLTKEQIKTFYHEDDIDQVIEGLKTKGYLKCLEDKYNPVCGNMSFEIFKFLDPNSISITLTSSDANRLGVEQNNVIRHITPRECARLQGFPDSFIVNPNDNSAYKQFGNSVSVPIIKMVLIDFIKNNLICEDKYQYELEQVINS